MKPYVHWDIPNEVKVIENRIGGIGLKLPHWVENKSDVLSSVVFETEAEESLRFFVRRNKLSPLLYPGNDSMSFVAAKQTLIEILSQDPRSSHRGLSKNQRGSVSGSPSSPQRNNQKGGGGINIYRLCFGKLEIEFIVTEKGAIVKNVLEGSSSSSPNPINEAGSFDRSFDRSFDSSTVVSRE